MITLSKALGCFMVDNPKTKVYNSIEEHARELLRRAAALGRFRLHRFMLFLVYIIHGFRIFNPGL